MDNIFFPIDSSSRQSRESNYSLVIEDGHLEQKSFIQLIDAYLEMAGQQRVLMEQLRALQQELSGREEEGEISGFLGSIQEVAENAYLIMGRKPGSKGLYQLDRIQKRPGPGQSLPPLLRSVTY